MNKPPKEVWTPACMACLDGVCRDPVCRRRYEESRKAPPEPLGSILERILPKEPPP